MDWIKNLLIIVAGVPAILKQNEQLRKENADLKKQLADRPDVSELQVRAPDIEDLAHQVQEATTEPSMSG